MSTRQRTNGGGRPARRAIARTTPKLVGFGCAVAIAAAVGLGCRKEPLDEHVWRGAERRPGATAGTGAPPRAGTMAAPPAPGGTGGSADAGSTPGDAGATPPLGELCGAAPAPDAPFGKPALLSAIAACAVARYADFEQKSADLERAVDMWAESRRESDLEAARSAWRVAMASWQEAELFRFGPAARAMEPGGQSLRDEIYSWPLVGRCEVEQRIVSRAYESEAFAESKINGRTLTALEYLLFYTGTDNACGPFSAINADGSWAALSGEELAARKAAYAAVVARDVHARAEALIAAWDPSGGDFCAEFTGAGRGSRVFATDQEAFNAVSNALFYIDKELKDWKLARPAGMTECSAPTCPEQLESLYAQVGTSNVRANLEGFRKLFQGCGPAHEGLGFDDWLREAGASDVADDMLAALDGAERGVDAMDPPLEQAIATDPDKVKALHTSAIKPLTDLLKADFVTVLDLELPMSTIGDND